MALTSDEADLFDAGRAAMPNWYTDDARTNEYLAMCAKAMGSAYTQVKHWLKTQAYTKQAAGPTSDEPDWLGQHAIDRGTRRQYNEVDASLRYRLTKIFDPASPQSITPDGLLNQAIAAVLSAFSASVSKTMVELPRDGIFLSQYTQISGTGGTFAGPASGTMTFTPTLKFIFPLFATGAVRGRIQTYKVVLSGASSGGNNGTFTVTGMGGASGNGALYANGSGVAGADAGVAWSVVRCGQDGQSVEGRRSDYLSRGFRLSPAAAGEIVVIIGYISDAPTRDAVQRAIAELLRLRKGAGVISRVETRANP